MNSAAFCFRCNLVARADADEGPLSLRASAEISADFARLLGGPIGETDRYPFLVAEIDVLERRLWRGRATLGIVDAVSG
jgi:GMP synthase (glutamine-hydrolysing)